jgi:hypothetical protein
MREPLPTFKGTGAFFEPFDCLECLFLPFKIVHAVIRQSIRPTHVFEQLKMNDLGSCDQNSYDKDPYYKNSYDKNSYDKLASDALEELLHIPGDDDFYERLERHHASKPGLELLWESTMTVPPWVNWVQLKRGQLVFSRYLIPILVGFGFQGFVGEIAAAPGPAKVLNHTKGLSAGRIWPRVSRTLQWLTKATESVESIQPGGEGHKSTIRVRLIHALVRRGIPQNKKTASGSSVVGVLRDKHVASYSTNDGVPLNTSDMILILTFFCCNPMWKQLPQLWVHPTDREKEDFVAFYRYIGYLLGIPTDSTDCLASAARAEQTMIALHADRKPPSMASQKITRTFVEAVTNKPPYNLSEGFVNAGIRRMNPRSVCDDLMIGEPGWLPHIAFMTLSGCVGLLTLIQSASALLEQLLIKVRDVPILVCSRTSTLTTVYSP